jgi:hypothetical protein
MRRIDSELFGELGHVFVRVALHTLADRCEHRLGDASPADDAGDFGALVIGLDLEALLAMRNRSAAHEALG